MTRPRLPLRAAALPAAAVLGAVLLERGEHSSGLGLGGHGGRGEVLPDLPVLAAGQQQDIRAVRGTTGTADLLRETQDVQVDVRVVTSTSRDLKTEIAEGRFREDLFHRLNVVPIRVPALSERREDIPP